MSIQGANSLPNQQTHMQQTIAEEEMLHSQEDDAFSEESFSNEDEDVGWHLYQNNQGYKEEENHDGTNRQSETDAKQGTLAQKVEVQFEKVGTSQEKKQSLLTRKPEGEISDENSKTVRKKISKTWGQPKGEIKSKSFTYDSKIVHAAFELLIEEFRALMNSDEGFVKVNPYENSKSIIIFYYDEAKLKEVKEKIDELVMEIETIPLNKIMATSGLQLSFKFNQKMRKEKMSFFNDLTQKYKTPSYYLCGRVELDDLQRMLDQIRQIKFTYLNLFRYQKTRSYKAIMSKVFSLPQTHAFITEKFQAKQIEVACLKKNFQLPDQSNPFMLLTFQRSRKLLNHQAIESSLYDFINETYAFFCFCFLRKKGSPRPKYTPKVSNVEWFFISEKKLDIPVSYLYIIAKRAEWTQAKEAIIEGIKSMKLNITGRRFFKNIHPTKQEIVQSQKHRITCYPKNYPYSWVFSASNGQTFDWMGQLKL